jgi:D-beta-D-heptose 7-phosphate kinase/D-beta-D-heptose 1-phosphate adenosyltransferase
MANSIATTMNADLPNLLDAFAGLRVLVVGEAMLDSYWEGSTGRFCPEAPVPVVALHARRDLPGGAANTAANARALGASVTLLSVVGKDAEGATLRQALGERGVATDPLLSHPERRTLTKQRVLAAGQLLLRLDQGSTGPLDAATERALIAALAGLFPRCDAVILSDYGYGILAPAVIRALADLQARWPKVVVADSRRLAAFHKLGVSAVKPNYAEAQELLGAVTLPELPDRAAALMPHGDRLLERTGAQAVVVTLDREGALVFERGRPPQRSYAPPARQAFVAGAGDTFAAALALSLAAGAPAAAATELASAAAAVVVGKERTAACSAGELREYLSAAAKYVPDLARLAARVDYYRQQGRKAVFTNGCFDILHRGHVSLLHRAKALGDVLVVGVNSDAGIRRLKGSGRPINSLDDRVQVLAALGCVDHLVPFDEDTPCNLIRALRPHAFVKGGDYTRERLPEAALVEELGGEVHLLPYLEDRSTTGLIARIQHQPRRRGRGADIPVCPGPADRDVCPTSPAAGHD